MGEGKETEREGNPATRKRIEKKMGRTPKRATGAAPKII
jgi:hypothetical protein